MSRTGVSSRDEDAAASRTGGEIRGDSAGVGPDGLDGPDGAKFGFIAGDPALDLVNTVDWRLDDARRVDLLSGYTNLLLWAELAGIVRHAEAAAIGGLAEEAPAGAGAALERAVQLREEIREAALGSVDRCGTIDEAYRRAQSRGELRRQDDGWAWYDDRLDLDTISCRIACSAVALLTSGAGQVRQCGDAACGWVFLDTSPRHNRRWCSQASCGDRNRARRYYQRMRSRPSSSDAGVTP